MLPINTKTFIDRADAGNQLAKKLIKYKNSNAIILSLVRGGVPIGYYIAKKLNLPLNIIIVRKIGAPGNPEFGIGAICENNIIIINKNAIKWYPYAKQKINQTIKNERQELKRRVNLYRKNKPFPSLKNLTVILTDDGLATGITMKAAIAAIKKLHAKNIVVALPVAAEDSICSIKKLVNDCVCILTPENLTAISLYYNNFYQVSDREVIDLLSKIKSPT